MLLVEIPVLLPFVMTYSVGYREPGAIFNDDFLRPGLTDLVGLSNPVLQPFMPYFSFDFLTYPGAYLGWFIVPTLAWVAWRGVPGLLRAVEPGRDRRRVVAAGAGTSVSPFFRWPIRLLPYLYITILVAWAVVMSRHWRAIIGGPAGWRCSRWWASVRGSGFGERPVGVPWQLGAALITAALCVVLVWVLPEPAEQHGAVRDPSDVRGAGSAAVPLPQQRERHRYDFPTGHPPPTLPMKVRGRTAADRGRHPGPLTVGLFGRAVRIDAERRRTGEPERLQRHRFRGHGQRTVMLYNGQTCPDLAGTVFDPVGASGRSMADYRPAAGRGGEMDGAGPADSRRLATGSARRLRQRVGTRANGARRARNGETSRVPAWTSHRRDPTRRCRKDRVRQGSAGPVDHARTTELAGTAPRSTTGPLHSETAPVDSSRWSCPLAPAAAPST